MKFIKHVAISLTLLGVTAPAAHAYNESPLNFKELGQKLESGILKCPERVWPGFSLKSVNLLLNADGLKPTLVRLGKGQVSELKQNQIPPDAFESLYSFPKFEGATAGAFYFSSSDQENYSYNLNDQALRLIVHESFHRFGQTQWVSATSGQRGTAYPIEALPRLYRRMTFGRLNDYFSSGGKDLNGLAKAAYWNQKWKKEFPSDYSRSLDQLEGTAKYVELIAAVLTEGGCDQSEQEIYEALRDDFAPEYRSFLKVPFQAEFEGYDIGALAGFSLRFVGNKRGWEARVAKGQSPLDLVFEGIDTMNDEISPGLKTPFMKAAQDRNQKYSQFLQPDIELNKNRDTIRIVPSNSSFQSGAFSSRGFFDIQEIPGTTAISLALPVKFSEHGWQLSVGPEKLLLSGGQASLCSGEYFIVVPKNEVKIKSGTIEVNTPSLNGSMPGNLKIDDTGKQWFCEAGPG